MTQAAGPPLSLLVIEDNPADVDLLREAFELEGTPVAIEHRVDGREALRWLRSSAGQPDLILLDLNLPGVPGLDALRDIKTDARLRRIPVLVYTSSRLSEDVDAGYRNHANAYLVKPLGFDGCQRLVRRIIGFWFEAAVLPREELSR